MKNMIKAIQNKDFVGFKAAFNDAITAKTTDTVDSVRDEVGSSVTIDGEIPIEPAE